MPADAVDPHPTQRYTEALDKPRLITHTRAILKRLRRRKILVDDIVAQINRQQFPLTRSRFIDLFTSRPDRLSMPVPELTAVFLHVSFAYDAQIVSAAAFIDFADAARLPLRYYGQFSAYFSTHDWQTAWYGALPSTRLVESRHGLYDREDAFEQGMHALSRGKHVVISGPAGVGKTAFAHALVLQYEMLTHQKIPIVSQLLPITTLDVLVHMIAAAYNIRPLSNEPLSLRLTSVFTRTQRTYVLIDCSDEHPVDVQLFGALLQLFPMLRLIIASPIPVTIPKTAAETVWYTVLKPLADEAPFSPAMLLFLRTLHQIDTPYTDADITVLHLACRRASGIPRDIIQLARSGTLLPSAISAPTIESILAGLSMAELRVLTFVAWFDDPVSVSFITAFLQHQFPAQTIVDACTRLSDRALIECQRSGTHRDCRLPAPVRAAYHSVFHPMQQGAEPDTLLDELTRFGSAAHIHMLAALRRSDALAVIGVLQRMRMQSPTALFHTVRLINSWYETWVYHDVTAATIVLAEQLVQHHHDVHPLLAELCITTARLCLSLGMHAQATQHLATACRVVSPQHYHVTWARTVFVTLEIALQRNDNASLSRLAADVRMAVRITADEDIPEWVAYAHHMHSNLSIAQDDLPAAVASSVLALQQSMMHADTAAYVTTMVHRSVVYMVTGAYALAEACLQQLAVTLHPYDLPPFTAAVQMRLAAVAALMHRPQQAHTHLAAALPAVTQCGSVSELLFIADIASLVLVHHGAYLQAVRVDTLCSTLRVTHAVARGDALEGYAARQRAKIPASVYAHLPHPDPDSTIADLLDVLQVLPLSTVLQET